VIIKVTRTQQPSFFKWTRRLVSLSKRKLEDDLFFCRKLGNSEKLSNLRECGLPSNLVSRTTI
ncbi:hypothetical protein U1Q18_008772, partial [Sarracenia purpurea var. burkii]